MDCWQGGCGPGNRPIYEFKCFIQMFETKNKSKERGVGGMMMHRFEWLMNDMSTISLFCIFNRTTVTVFLWNVFPTSPPSPLYKRNMLKSMNYYRHIIPNDASFLYREKTSLPSIFYTYPTENFFFFFGIVTIYLYNIIVFVYRIV